MWEPFLWLALLVAAWRWLRQPAHTGWETGSLPDVADAPADAEPIVRPRLDDNGLATYTMVIPREAERPGEPSEDAN
jgi:hypothetical protein